MEQRRLRPEAHYHEVDAWLRERGVRRLFLVHGKSLEGLPLGRYFAMLEERTGIRVVSCTDFRPNPLREEAEAALAAFRAHGCDAIAAAGGGSAMDVAKCVRLWSGGGRPVPLLAMPTTAGTGSEATHFAVVYRGGEKQSVSDELCRPDAFLLDPASLTALPAYHRKSSMLDALCHGIESFWSRRADDASRALSRQAIETLWAHADGYLSNTPAGNAGMLEAAYLAGRAIDRAQTTAGHAMCYKLTGLYGIAHGHAASLCVRALWPYMAERAAGTPLEGVLRQLAEAMGCGDTASAIAKYNRLLDRLDLPVPAARAGDLALLRDSVNPERLGNHPLPLDRAALEGLYRQILQEVAL